MFMYQFHETGAAFCTGTDVADTLHSQIISQ